jgi:hypothetical protein
MQLRGRQLRSEYIPPCTTTDISPPSKGFAIEHKQLDVVHRRTEGAKSRCVDASASLVGSPPPCSRLNRCLHNVFTSKKAIYQCVNHNFRISGKKTNFFIVD